MKDGPSGDPAILLLSLGFCCLFLFAFVGLGGGLIWYFLRAGRRLKQPLASWSNDSLTSLSFRTVDTWSRAFGNLNLKGQILTAANHTTPSLVAFDLNIKGQWTTPRGRMQARTSLQTFDYEITPEAITIIVDSSPLGSLQPDGFLLDATGRTIGRARRPDGQPFLPSRKGLTEPGYEVNVYPVIFGERTVAAIANPVGGNRKEFTRSKGAVYPAVSLVDNCTDEERNWVLALAILQIVSRNLPGTGSAMGPATGVP